MSDQSVVHGSQSKKDTSFDSTRPWLRHYEQGVPAELEIPDRPLTWLLDQTVSHHAGHTAFIYYGTKLSYAQFSSLANRFATGLQRLGIKKGDRVAIALPNIPQYPIAFYGALRAGAVVVPTNPLYTEREMQHQLADSGARFIVMLDMFYPIVRTVRANTELEHIIVTSPTDYLPPMLQRLYPFSQLRAHHLKPLLTEKELHGNKMLHVMSDMLGSHTKGGIEVFNLPVRASGDDLAVLQYTGGTTGLSKGAMLMHRNLLANALQTRSWNPNTREGGEVVLCVAPFFHSYGLTVGMNYPILSAATMILLPQFKSKEVVTTIRRYHPTQLPGIPTMYIAIMREIGKHAADLRSIKYCISGAMGLPAKVRKDWEALTGGKLVEEGYFYVSDRSKDMIKASGFNVYPREVEEVLLLHPSVAEAAVIGIPHEYRGETVAAVIVLKPGFEVSEETRDHIIAYCKKELTPYKVPKFIEFRESLPKTLIGKVLKRELRATFKPL